jgi:DNA-binding CsgD family transcriptional regulator/tetratricopeptide (TPR) repeat protein
MPQSLLGRQAELEAITTAACQAARGNGSALVVEGPAGIGKTAIVRVGCEIARELGLTSLMARGAELERDFGFGVVRQLFEPVIDANGSIDEAFAGRAAPAAGLLDVVQPVSCASLPGGADAARATLNALYWLTVNLARLTPRVLVVDDAHWSDPASLRFLAYLTHRIESLPLMLIVAARPAGEPGGAHVAPIFLGEDVTWLRLAPLAERAAGQLVRAALPGVTDDLCDACVRASRGNPFYLRELTKTLRERGPTEPDAVLKIVPHGIATTVRSRIARLPAQARLLVSAVAVLGDGGALRHASQAAGLDDRMGASAADALIAADILASVRPLRFRHPLIRAAVYEQLSLSQRAIAHEHAARLLACEGAPPERVAAHLLESHPRKQASVCEQLRAAAREGVRRGAPDAAVTYLRRALEEPPPTGLQSELLIELGEAEALTLAPGPAAEHLTRGIEGIQDPARRLDAALVLAGILVIDHRGAEAVEVLEQALADSQNADPAQHARVEAHLVNVARFDLITRRKCAAHAMRLRRRAREGVLDTGIELTAAAAEEAMAGLSADRTAELAERAIERLAVEGTFPADYTVYTATRCLLVADRLEAAGRVLDNALGQAVQHGAVVSAAGALAFRSDVHYRVGELQPAADAAHNSLNSFRSGWRTGLPATAAILAKVLVEQGHVDAAATAVKDAGLNGPPNSVGSSYPHTMLLHARGGLRLAQGQPRAALEDLLEVGRRQESMGEPNPALMDWRSLAALALFELDRRGEALALAEDEIRLARRFGAPRALGIALRAAGVICNSDGGLDRLREAEAVLARSPARLAHAHALISLGAAMRQCRERATARDLLTRGVEIAHICGARPLQVRGLKELRATGLRPRRPATQGPDALTAGERRAAELAAQGLSNREIANGLYVTVRTVEYHLSGAFKKLGIRSRNELAHHLPRKATTPPHNSEPPQIPHRRPTSLAPNPDARRDTSPP